MSSFIELKRQLQELVVENGFNNIAVLLAWLNHLESQKVENTSASIQEMYEKWQPNSDSFIELFGGTNCIGLTKVLVDAFSEYGFNSELLVTPSNNLPEGVSVEDVPFQHVAFSLLNPEDNKVYLFDPGLGLVEPIAMSSDEKDEITIADRVYRMVLKEDCDTLEVTKPNGVILQFDFIRTSSDFNVEKEVQKPLLRATTSFKIDAFNPQGHKTASIKINFIRRNIVYFVHGDVNGYSFDELEKLKSDPNFQRLVHTLEDDALGDKLEKIIKQERDVVDTWLEPLQRSYYKENPNKLSPIMFSWSELKEMGYEGGGVVAVIINENNELLMYQVPEGKAKPRIGRNVGDLNLFTETAELMSGGQSVAELEELSPNLARLCSEELGVPVPENYTYFETNYGLGPIRARVVVWKVNQDSFTVKPGDTFASEIGEQRWVNVRELFQQQLEPNARGILDLLIQQGVVSE